jgi:uncharacterized protein YcnI
MKRPVVIAAIVTAGLVPAATAHGHAVVQPSTARPADPQVYTLTVPNEADTPTTDVRLRVPKGIDFALLESPPPGWKGELVRKGDAISELHWSGGEIPPDQYGTFRFLVRNPVEEGEIVWSIIQSYEGGDVQRWIGGPDSDTPASRTQISESATPENIIAVNGERIAEAKAGGTTAAAPAAAKAAKAADPGRDGLTLGLATAALALAAAALLTALRRRSPSQGTAK